MLGLLSDAAYKTASVEARDGDLLVIFSDGIVEAPDGRGEPFGEHRLIAVTQAHQTRRAHEICDAILAAVRTFAGSTPVQDDQTLLVVRLWQAGNRPAS